MQSHLAEREEIICFVNRMRFVTRSQLQRKFSARLSLSRLRSYCRQGYLQYERIFYTGEGIYRATIKGVKACGDMLGPVKSINLSTYRHDLQVVDLALTLTENTGGTWISEREIKHREKLKAGWNRSEPVPDGVLQLSEGIIAVELENTPKPLGRMEKILRSYVRSDYDEVWYFTRRLRVADRIEALCGKLPFVRVICEGNDFKWGTF